MTMASTGGLRFVPSRVDGLPDVTDVAVFPDRLELLSAGKWVVIRLLESPGGIVEGGYTALWPDSVSVCGVGRRSQIACGTCGHL